MPFESLDRKLSQITTLWSLVCQAHGGPAEPADSARRQLLDRYGGAIHRYLHKVLYDPDAAADVFQEFALRLIHGDLRGANPRRGRFRDFVKGTLFHLIADHHQQQRDWPRPLPAGADALAVDPQEEERQRRLVESWRDQLLARAWESLARSNAGTGQPFYAVLRFRAEHPRVRSPQMAVQLAVQLGRPFTSAGIRQTLHRAREQFADLLLDEVTHSLDNPTADQLEEELGELSLLDYCRPALERCAANA